MTKRNSELEKKAERDPMPLMTKEESSIFWWIFSGIMFAGTTIVTYQDMVNRGYQSFPKYFNEVIMPGLEHLNEALYLM